MLTVSLLLFAIFDSDQFREKKAAVAELADSAWRHCPPAITTSGSRRKD